MNQGSLDLTGKSAIVTGASRGIGEWVAKELAAHGAQVALAARSMKDLKRVAEEIEASGGKAIVVEADLSEEESIQTMVSESVSKMGGLDIIVNNAGIGIYGPLEKATGEDWDAIMNVNAKGVFFSCREAIPHLKKKEVSYIINITSVVGHKGYPNQSLYSASKHAVMGMSKALAKEVQEDGIRVHAICPGGVDTDMVAQARPDLDRSILMKPQDIADIVLFLVTRHGNAVVDEVQIRRASSTPWA